MTTGGPRAEQRATTEPRPSPNRWLVFVHQLPVHPSNLRVRTWRRLQQIGALAVKQAVYVLPDSPSAREDFEWLKADIESAGGQASLFAADTVDSWSHDALVDEFRGSRQDAYTELLSSSRRGRLDHGRWRSLDARQPPRAGGRRDVAAHASARV